MAIHSEVMAVNLLAHSKNAEGRTHPLREHLTAVADLAAQFASAWGAEEEARLAGLLHDVGKASDQFQAYVRGKANRGGDHATAGALRAAGTCDLVAFAIAGHHGGMPDVRDLKSRLKGFAPGDQTRTQALLAELPLPCHPGPPDFAQSDASEAELSTRMLFSALVDADFLDTERHFDAVKANERIQWASLDALWERFRAQQEALMLGATETPLNAIRRAIYEQCLAAAESPQGLFSLTVPTGGGKTLSAMGFALKHALRWGLRRIIVVIPYTSIIEQTADVYRRALGENAVLEHHSAVDWGAAAAEERRRCDLASENWDAPVIVTTSVQFFESLMSNRPAACRKLHHVARSVIILDEVQTLPTGILEPSFRVLSSLVRHYGTTVVLSTATHPAYRRIMASAQPPEIHEIAVAPEKLFRQLKRVEYDLGGEAGPTRMDWLQVAVTMQAADQAMAVVNTRRDARALFEQLPAASRAHLSTNLCGAHRRAVLGQVRQCLADGAPCHLATTQLVEAGVDLDFPLVLRAIAPLDRIVQAAGRCNREGRAACGRVVVFEPTEGGMPPGAYCSGAGVARAMLRQCPLPDLHDPATYTAYFSRLYHAVPLDERQIARDRERLMFETVAHNYRVIEDDSVSVVVPWREGIELLERISARGCELTREDLRALQPYFVSLQRREHEHAVRDGLCREVAPGLWRWEGRYDEHLGIALEHDGQQFLHA